LKPLLLLLLQLLKLLLLLQLQLLLLLTLRSNLLHEDKKAAEKRLFYLLLKTNFSIKFQLLR
jgi:hypothetical protein